MITEQGWCSEDLTQISHKEYRGDENVAKLTDPDEPFDNPERDRWREKIDEVLRQLEDNSEKLKEESGTRQSEITDLRRELDELKATIERLPRATWMRAAGNRMLVFFDRFSRSEAGKALAETAVKGLIGNGD
jgi:predicted nuclease with TOPRIM domain